MKVVCTWCGTTTAKVLHVCSGCLKVGYCSTYCADRDWESIHAHHHQLQELKLVRVLRGLRGVGSVYLGSVDAIRDADALKENAIDFVISVLDNRRHRGDGGELMYPLEWNERAVGGADRLLRITLWDDESENISQYFDLAADTIQEHVLRGHNVLIHCVAGHSRSVTLLIYYMLKYKVFERVDDALRYIKKRRPFAQPNSGFMEQLYDAETQLLEDKKRKQ